jgi:hypothetical protein
MAYKKTKKLTKKEAPKSEKPSLEEAKSFDSKKEEPMDLPEEEIVEKVVLPKASPLEKKIEEEKPPKDVAKLPVAMPSEEAQKYETTVALKTTVKRCGSWFKLVADKKVTGTKEQIAYLRSCGLVK